MTEELQEYLKRSKESRAKLTKLAKQVESVNNSFSLSPNPNDSDYFKPKRFKDFEENMSKDLQKIFRRESLFKHPIVKSRSSCKRTNQIASIYNYIRNRSKIPAVLPPVKQNRKISIPERLLGGKYADRSSESSPTVASGSSVRRSFNSRLEVRQKLFVPVLSRNKSKPRQKIENLL
jgi:hypothetical protein